jgi:hypothetical protein
MNIIRKSPFTGKVATLDLAITQEQINLYENGGVLLQDAFPNLTPDEREFFKTGLTAEDWDTLFVDK